MPNNNLGKQTTYAEQYSPGLLFPIARKQKRDELDIALPLPFCGYDLWNAYEISWLNARGKPMVALGTMVVPAESSHIVESKSLKLYLNSFNQTHFDSYEAVTHTITKDLSKATQSNVTVAVYSLHNASTASFETLSGCCLDDLDIHVNSYSPQPELLITKNSEIITETVYSHLLKSNCPVTNQPDWGSLEITYTGAKINHENLLKYIISLRKHNEFHEQCVERIFMDILKRCQPTELSVYARYTRRGGIDINPFRTTNPRFAIKNLRLVRQ